MAVVKLTVNGNAATADVDPNMPLLNFLMEDMGLNGPKFDADFRNAELARYCWKGNLYAPASLPARMPRVRK